MRMNLEEDASMKAALIVFPACSLWQVSHLVDILGSTGWTIRVLSLGKEVVHAAGGVQISPDEAIEDAHPRDFHFVIVPGGPIELVWLQDSRVHRFLRQYDGTRNYIAAIDSGTLCLSYSGLLGGIRFTTTDKLYHEYRDSFHHAAYTGSTVTVDANVISARQSAYLSWTDCVLRTLGTPSSVFTELLGEIRTSL